MVTQGNAFMRVWLSVSQSVCPREGGGSHVTITQEALDLIIQGPR